MSHVPLFHAQSSGCHYIDLQGYSWSTFTKYGGDPEACDLCGRAISSGYWSPYGAHLCVGCALHTGECIYCLACGATYLWWDEDGPAPAVTSKPWDEKHLPIPPRLIDAHCDICGEQLARSWSIQAYRLWERGANPVNFEFEQLGAATCETKAQSVGAETNSADAAPKAGYDK